MIERKLRATLEIDGRTGCITAVFSDALDEKEHAAAQQALARIMRPSESDVNVRLLAGFGRREGTTNFLCQGNVNAGGG